jgi:hypothetical protein
VYASCLHKTVNRGERGIDALAISQTTSQSNPSNADTAVVTLHCNTKKNYVFESQVPCKSFNSSSAFLNRCSSRLLRVIAPLAFSNSSLTRRSSLSLRAIVSCCNFSTAFLVFNWSRTLSTCFWRCVRPFSNAVRFCSIACAINSLNRPKLRLLMCCTNERTKKKQKKSWKIRKRKTDTKSQKHIHTKRRSDGLKHTANNMHTYEPRSRPRRR